MSCVCVLQRGHSGDGYDLAPILCKYDLRKVKLFLLSSVGHLLLSTHSHDPLLGGESDVPACGPPARLSVHLASSVVTPAGSVHKSRGDNVVRMWVQLNK